MSIQKVPLDSVQKIRQYIKSVLSLPDSENHPKAPSWSDSAEELPEPESLADLSGLFNVGSLVSDTTYIPNAEGRWFISSTDPGATLLKLPGLQLEPNLRLVSYLYRIGEDGTGVVWAVPESLSTTANLEEALESGDRETPPQPEGALTNVMDAIAGDHSPVSFVVASILFRELKEFGALGKYCNWSHHRLINAIPTQVNWQWRGNTPKDFSTKVKIFPDGKAAVEFFTCRVVTPIAIFQHLDQYPGGNYQANSLERAIAIPIR